MKLFHLTSLLALTLCLGLRATTAAPVLTNQAATVITTNSAVLNATVNPNGAVTALSFQYGLTTAYGNNSSTQSISNTRLAFNGVNQTASLSAAPAWLGTGNIPHTVEAWINPASLPTVREWPLLLGTAGNGSHHWLIATNGVAQIGVYGVASVTNLLPLGVWTHIASSFDGTTLSVYTNGVLVGAINVAFNLQGASLLLAQAQLSEKYYVGGLDEIRIWNTARSASQIQTNLARTLTGSESGLVAYYRMDEGSGTAVNDLTGHGNNLVTANSPTWTTGAPVNYSAQASIGTLTPGSLYHFNAIATNSSGGVTGTDLTFTTLAVAPTFTPTNASGITTSGALLNAQINPNGAATTFYFQYGLTASYGSSTATNLLTATNVFVATNATVSGLQTATTYHYRVIASNSVGLTTGSDQTFVTTGLLPSLTTQAASAVTNVSALLNVQINPNNSPTALYFQYGVNTGYGNSSATNLLTATNIFIATNALITGLQSATAYHYRVVASNTVGTTNGPDQTFTTTGYLPTITTQPASAVTGTNALLNAQINPNSLATTFYFQYGATISYGSFSATNSLAATNIFVATNTLIAGLQPITAYHYRVVASNSVGSTNGGDQTFTTLAGAPTATTQPAGNITLISATLNGTVNPNGAYSTWYFQYGTNTSYGSVTPVLPVVNGLTFDGSTVNAGNLALNGITSGNQPHTMEAWINPTLAPAAREWILTLGGFNDGSHHWLLNQNGTAQIGIFAGAQVNVTLSSNVWTHLAASYDGTTLTVYTNGQLAGSIAAAFMLYDLRLYVSAGYPGDTYYAGGLAEFRLWNTARSQAQIQATMNTSLTGAQTNLIMCLPLSEGGGTVANDLSGSNNSIDLYGNLAWNTALPPVLTPANVSTRSFSRSLTNLIPGTTYHFQLVASNSAGVSAGVDRTFTTLVLPPAITLLPISNVSTSGVTFHASINPNYLVTTGYFQYGLTTNYGNRSTAISLPAENASDAYDVSVAGLMPGALYHYQLVATNQGGATLSADRTFVAGFPPDVSVLPASGVTATNATLNVIVNPRGLPTGGRIEWGAFMNFDHRITLPIVSSNAPVSFSFPVTNLIVGIPYHYRVFASNSLGFVLGREVRFYANNLTLNGSPVVTNNVGAPLADPGANATALPANISAGYLAGYAVRANGTGVAWGGYPPVGDAIIPGGANNFAFIRGSVISYSAIALGVDGSVFSIGQASTYNSLPPNLTNVMAFAQGGSFGLALRGDGTVLPWGYGSGFNVPASATNVTVIAAGYGYGAALRADGSVIAWGDNSSGQTAVSGSATNVIDIAAAGTSCLALRADGSLVSWGGNSSLPTDATNITSISGGAGHYLAVRADGKLFAWGNDSGYGELSIPTEATNIVTASAGDNFSLALRADGQILGWGANTRGAISAPGVTNLNLPVSVNSSGSNLPGTNFLTYTTTNASGYVATAVRTVIVSPGPPPLAVTQPANAVTNSSAALQGLVSLDHGTTAAFFQYGTTTGYGSNTPSRFPATSASGVIFNGPNQFLAGVGYLTGLPSGNAPHTIEAWLKPTLQPAVREWVLLLGDVASGSHHWLLNHNGSTQIGCFGGSQLYPQLSPNVWSHIASSFDGTNLSVYLNGVLVGTTPATFNLNGASLTLAADRIGESYYSGGMDKVAIWSTGRTAQQIQADMVTRYTGAESGLAMYLQLEEGTGYVANSATTNVNHLSSIDPLVWGSGTPLTQMVVTQNITGLAAVGTYHYRVVATNFGGTTYGDDVTFLLRPPAVAFSIFGSTISTNGDFQFSFTNTPGASFSVLAQTNIGAPLTNWMVFTNVVENPPGYFNFTIPQQTTNYRGRFFRVQSP